MNDIVTVSDESNVAAGEANLLTIISEVEQTNCYFRVCEWSGFSIEMLKSKKAPDCAEFLPARVLKDDGPQGRRRVWWSFKRDHANYNGLGWLVEHEGEYHIVLATKGALHTVLPIVDLPNLRQTDDGEFIGGRKLRELVLLKDMLAKRGGVTPIWTEREAKMRDALQKQAAATRKAARETEEAERVAKRAANQAERDRKIAELKGRKIVHVTIENGVHRRGIPVVGDEWKILPDDTHCVLVSAYNAETGEAENPLESFKIVKTTRGRECVSVGKVVMAGTEANQRKLPKLPSKMMPFKGDIEEIFLATSIDVVKEYHDSGLNSGALVAAPEGDSKDRYTVFELRSGMELKTVGTIGRPNN